MEVEVHCVHIHARRCLCGRTAQACEASSVPIAVALKGRLQMEIRGL